MPGIAKPPSAAAPPADAPLGAPPMMKGLVRRDERPARAEAAAAGNGEHRSVTPPRETNGFVGSGNGNGGRNPNLPGLAPSATPQLHRPPAPVGTGNGNGNGSAHGNGSSDARRTLHLSLGTASPGNGGAHPAEPAAPERHNGPGYSQHPQPQAGGERLASPVDRAAQHAPAAADRGHNGTAGPSLAEARPTAYYGPVQQTGSEGGRRKDSGTSFIDQELRARVDADIAAFLAAFDAALAEDTPESRSALREATDRLLRAGARTRIELERLEARLPLPVRDTGGRGEAAWRHR